MGGHDGRPILWAARDEEETGVTRKSRRSGGPIPGPAAPTEAESADKHALYERAVQEPEADVNFAIDAFRSEFGRRAYRLREDFCGTAAVCRDWVLAHKKNRAWGVDLNAETLSWGRAHNLDKLPKKTRRRVALVEGDVRTKRTPPVDVVMASNFSYFLFTERTALLRYLRAARRNLDRQGLLVLDAYGGPESVQRVEDETEHDDFSYIWDQDDFDPINRMATCYIHFTFGDGSALRRAFTYRWRMYTIPEIRDALADAGFASSTVYWEGTDAKTGEGDGNYTPQESADPDEAWVCYIVAAKR